MALWLADPGFEIKWSAVFESLPGDCVVFLQLVKTLMSLLSQCLS